MRAFSFLLLFVLLGLPASLWAQEAVPSDSLRAWNVEVLGKLAASQAGYQNWQEGGINTLAFTVSTAARAKRTTGAWQQSYQGRLAFGQVKQDTLDFRKADDVIRLAASLQYNGEGFFATFNPTVAAEVRTQFAKGFNYDKDPLGQGRTPPVLVSAFLAPGTFTESIGLTYDPNDWFTQRIGLGIKETVVRLEQLRPLYGLDLDQTVRVEAGLESFTEIERELFENVSLRSALGLFAAFNQADQPDALWENLLVMEINQYLSVNFEFVTLYDRDISTEAQFKEVLSLGVSVTLL